MLAATGTDSTSATRSRSVASRPAATGSTTAIIAAVVAVFETNIDSSAVMHISPATIDRGDVPKGRSMTPARLRSRPYLVAASASTNPPRNNISTGSARVAKIDS